MHLDMNPLETRVLGCLLEKERTTPEAYPLTLNSVTAAVNQTSNRDPVMSVEAAEVEAALEGLRARKVATLIMMAGSRAAKFRHELADHYDLDPAEAAVICVLLLRGAQTVGELKTRTERMHPFEDSTAVEQCLSGLEKGEEPLVRQMAPPPGKKGTRWVQLLSGEPSVEAADRGVPQSVGSTAAGSLHERVSSLESEVAALREELADFRRQFEA